MVIPLDISRERHQMEAGARLTTGEHKGGPAPDPKGALPGRHHWPSAGRLAWVPEPASCGLPRRVHGADHISLSISTKSGLPWDGGERCGTARRGTFLPKVPLS